MSDYICYGGNFPCPGRSTGHYEPRTVLLAGRRPDNIKLTRFEVAISYLITTRQKASGVFQIVCDKGSWKNPFVIEIRWGNWMWVPPEGLRTDPLGMLIVPRHIPHGGNPASVLTSMATRDCFSCITLCFFVPKIKKKQTKSITHTSV